MAETRVSRKFQIYQSLHEINAVFQTLDNNFETMILNQLLDPDSVGVWRNQLGELQAEINMDLTGTLHQQESKEIRRFAPLVEAHEEAEIAKATAKAAKKKPIRKKR